ncbi:MAG: hypothetical protein ABIN20_02870 [candidate division WOR-3 bacterium]
MFFTTIFFILSQTQIDIDEFKIKVKEKWESIKTCICEYNTFQKKGDKIEEASYFVYFKKPLWTRLKVLKGKNKDSEAMYNPEKNIVRGRKGGLIKGIVLTLKPDDGRVVSIRGFKTYDAGISGVYLRFLKYMDEGYEMEYIGNFEEKGFKGKKIKVKILNPEKFYGFNEEIFWFTEDYVPYRLEGFEKGEKVLDSQFYMFKLNVEIEEEIWQL